MSSLKLFVRVHNLVKKWLGIGEKLVSSEFEVWQSWSGVDQELGQELVTSWSEVGQELVRSWSECGQEFVRSSSEDCQILVRRTCLTNYGPSLDQLRPTSDELLTNF